ncbi:MAG: NAD-dependent DNA ligase LigA [Bacteroidota bacterium]
MSKNSYKKTPFPEWTNVEDLSSKEASKEVERLREAIEYHNQKYYIDNDPAISDKAYDKLFGRLEKIEKKFPKLQSEISPTRKIGAQPVDSLNKKKHQALMLSLNSSDKKEEIDNFLKYVKDKTGEKSPDYMLEPKFDGVSIEIVYKKGAFDYAATRGDGEIGEDISNNIKTVRTVPLKLMTDEDLPETLAVQGEIFISREGFQALNKERIEKDEKPFANARNAVAGLVRQLDSAHVAGKPLDIFFYEVLGSGNMAFENQEKMLLQLERWGFKTNDLNTLATSKSDILDFFEKIDKTRSDLPYEIDGMVIKINKRNLHDKLGHRDRSPRWAFAVKFEPQRKITRLVDIIVQVGRTGILTPVALLDPVEVGGVTVSRATLHNEDEVKKKDVRPGDKVKIIRAGDVIPEVDQRVKESGKNRKESFKMPAKCPACNTKVIREGAYILCPAGLACPAQLKGRLIHYSAREAMDIENLGEKNIKQLVERKMVKNIYDIYTLKPSDLKDLEGFSDKSAEKLYDAIQNSKKPGLDQFLYALGIRHVGRHIAKVLARRFHTLDAVINASYEDLAEIQEIGPEIGESISHFFNNNDNKKMIKKLRDAGVRVAEEEGEKSNKLQGKTYVITGKLTSFSRDEAKDKIESLGGKTTSSVSDNTDYLVVGEDPGSKLDEAKKRKVEILDEKEFKKILEK